MIEHAVTTDSAQPRADIRIRILTVLAALGGGVLFGALAAVQHQATVMIAGTSIPIGLVCSLLAYGSIMLWLRLSSGLLPLVLFSAGVMLTVVVYCTQSPGGSVIIQADTVGWAWLLGSLAITAWAVISASLANLAHRA